MRNFFLLIALVFSAGLVHAEDPLTLPVNFDQGVPIIDISVNGKDYPFMVDLGASDAFYLADAVAKQIPDLTYTGKKVKSIDLTGKVQESDEIVVNDLVANGMHFGKMTGRIYAPWGMNLGASHGLRPDVSVIGLRFFEHKKVLLDFAKKSLQITEGDAATLKKNEEHWVSMPYEWTHEGLVVEVGSDVNRYHMILDSPATISVVNRKRIPHQEEVGKCKLNLGPDKVCEYIAVSIPGGAQFTPILMDLPEKFTADGILGRDFFARFAILVDPDSNTLMLKARK